MSDFRPRSNVYYLPVAAVAAASPVATSIEAYLSVPVAAPRVGPVTQMLWKLRLAVAEVRAIFRRPLPAVLGGVAALPAGWEVSSAPTVRPGGLARILHFDATRSRRRP